MKREMEQNQGAARSQRAFPHANKCTCGNCSIQLFEPSAFIRKYKFMFSVSHIGIDPDNIKILTSSDPCRLSFRPHCEYMQI
jgi:hypothetical protein